MMDTEGDRMVRRESLSLSISRIRERENSPFLSKK